MIWLITQVMNQLTRKLIETKDKQLRGRLISKKAVNKRIIDQKSKKAKKQKSKKAKKQKSRKVGMKEESIGMEDKQERKVVSEKDQSRGEGSESE